MSPARTFFYGMAMGSAMSLGSCSSLAQEVNRASVESEGRTDLAVEEIVVAQAQTSLIQNTFIASPIAGTVRTVAVREGQRVNGGEVLVRLDGELAKNELSAAGAALEAARLESDNDVNLRFARRSLQVREQELLQSELANQTFAGAVSEMELREIRLTVDQAELAIEQAERDLMIARASVNEKKAAVAMAETNLQRHTIRTSVRGLVSEIDTEPGEWVEAGKPLVRIISLETLRVECFVDGTKFGRDLVGRNVKFAPKGTAKEAVGRVTFVSPELHPVTGQVRLWATIQNIDEAMGSGLQGNLMILPADQPAK